jgi:hypothetical protein
MADPIGAAYANCDCCTGSAYAPCCDANLPTTLNIEITNSCGTWSGTLTFDPTLGSGVARCWGGDIDAECFGGGGPCTAHVINVMFCCQLTGLWTITLGCDDVIGGGTTSAMDVVCSPFVATNHSSLSGMICLQCVDDVTITE